MSPNDIEVLLHYHCSRSVHPRIDAPAVTAAIDRFVKAGLLTHTGEPWVCEATEGGQMLVEQLCAVPFPVLKWVRGEEFVGCCISAPHANPCSETCALRESVDALITVRGGIMSDEELNLAKNIGEQMSGKILCPRRCIERQELVAFGDFEDRLFCPHCELEVHLTVKYA